MKTFPRDWLPHGIVKRTIRDEKIKRERIQRALFYTALFGKNDLVFDVGANCGNRCEAFREIGASVVAVEPQASCCEYLRTKFRNDSKVKIVQKAAGAAPGKAILNKAGERGVLSSLSQTFIAKTVASSRFRSDMWHDKEEVELITLDELIRECGKPAFIKIDVEGFELDVLKGLSQPVQCVSLEWTPELNEAMLACLNLLENVNHGACEYNLSWGESMRFALSEWCGRSRLEEIMTVMRDETFLFGDIYVRMLIRPTGNALIA